MVVSHVLTGMILQVPPQREIAGVPYDQGLVTIMIP